jgi:hypothetical protein
VNRIDPTDDGPDSKTGCSTLFIWYLFSQLGFNINEIVAAAGSPLSVVYQKLMDDPSDPFLLFLVLVNKILPGSSQITNGTDNLFPATFDGALLQIRGRGPVWVIYGNGRFQVPDAATLARLFPGASIFPYGDFLFAIKTIPDDGTLLREESSSQVWLIQERTRVLASPNTSGTVHLLWDGALAQIPIPNGTLAGTVTDENGAPLNDATVLISSTSIIRRRAATRSSSRRTRKVTTAAHFCRPACMT